MAIQPSQFVVLLRGINVGGKNVIPMESLRRCFEELNFHDVRTYIQSGNILFCSTNRSIRQLTQSIEDQLSRRFRYQARVVILSRSQYVKAATAAPKDWGRTDTDKHNVLFVLSPQTPARVLKAIPPPREGIERVVTGPGVLFWSVSKKQIHKTSMMKLSGSPIYQDLTVRNHNTFFKLLELLQSGA